VTTADFRGVWASGRPGASTLWFHLVGPNPCGEIGEDSASGFKEIYDSLITPATPGSTAHYPAAREILKKSCMFATSTGSLDGTAYPRSMHPGGINVCFCDGSVHFISDFIEVKGVMSGWYVDFDHLNPARLATWERLNASCDGLPIESTKYEQ